MNNFYELIQFHFGQLPKEDLTILTSYFKEEKLKKNEFFTKSEKICDRLSFVKSGIVRVYALHDGKEVTQWISTKDYLITEVSGFFFDEANRWNIQAFTEVELWTITKTDYRLLCEKYPKWLDIEKRFLVKCFKMIEDRVFTHLSMSAEERYERYFEWNSELFNQVPLHYIASVLGMTPETFSRIRRKQLSKP